MFRIRASFELGCKSLILYLFLALAFNGKASDAKYEELGCEFADNQYKIERNSNNNQFPTPIFSLEGIDSISLDDLDDNYWKPIEAYLSEATVMNDVTPFVQFAKSYYENHTAESLNSFFLNYDVPFLPNETSNSAAYLIQMFHRLKQTLTQQGKPIPPCYIVSAIIDPSDQDISDAIPVVDRDAKWLNRKRTYSDEEASSITQKEYENKKRIVRKLHQKRVQDHLAGVIKVESGKWSGYVLIEPGYANGDKLINPFGVFLMDKDKRNIEFMNGFTNNEEIGFTRRKGSSFILAKYKNLKSETTVLYYVAKPYCSFMENTIKANLLRLNHGIVARDPKKKRQGYLTFKISAETDKDNGLIIKEIGNTIYGKIKQEKQLSFTDLSSIDPAIKTIQTALGISNVTSIIDQLKYIQRAVLGNSTFKDDFIGLTQKLDLDKEPAPNVEPEEEIVLQPLWTANEPPLQPSSTNEPQLQPSSTNEPQLQRSSTKELQLQPPSTNEPQLQPWSTNEVPKSTTELPKSMSRKELNSSFSRKEESKTNSAKRSNSFPQLSRALSRSRTIVGSGSRK